MVYGGEWETLDDEFTYGKFINSCKAIEKEIETISDPISVPLENIKYEIDNKFLSYNFFTEKKFPELVTYNRKEAVKDIIINCFNKKLKMSSGDGSVDYHKTKNKKIWSFNGRIRYITAFGTYIFNTDRWDRICNKVGTYDDMIKEYENDKKELETFIIREYKKTFL